MIICARLWWFVVVACFSNYACNQFRRENIKTVYYSLQSIRCLGPEIWEFVPNNIKYSNSLNKFKKLIKSWKPAQTLFLKSLFFFFNCYCHYKFWSAGVI